MSQARSLEVFPMSQILSISDEAYRKLLALANERGQTPEALIEAWIAAFQAETSRDPYTDPRYQTFEEFFEELGMTSEEIRQAKEKAKTGDADL
jgi:hypothetical protein